MNCKQIQELLPLYVGRDLEEKRAKLVTAHVQSCAECADLADEYRETRQLLQLFAPPPFSEAVFAGIRQRVLREIERESTAPTLPQLVASLFRPRIRWAVATALLLAFSVFAFYFIANRTNDRQQAADGRRTIERTTREEQANPQSPGHESAVSPPSSSEETDGHPPASIGRNAGAGTRIAGSGAHQSQQKKNFAAAADRPRSVAANMPDTRWRTAGASAEGNNLSEPDAIPARDPVSSEKTLRMEMQTKDPHIRIIWFSPQPGKRDSPSKSSKGIQEARSYV